MNIIYLIIIIAGSGQNIAKKFYTEKTGTNGTYLFSSLTAFFQWVTYVVSKVFYKEKLTKIQFAGFLTGLASIVLLNI